jgi:hypothetical protein
MKGIEVSIISIEKKFKKLTVYNIKVETNHNYFESSLELSVFAKFLSFSYGKKRWFERSESAISS